MNTHFGQCFQAILRRKNLRQNEAAALLGVTQATISRWQNAKFNPRLETCRRIAESLGVTVDELFGKPAGVVKSAPSVYPSPRAPGPDMELLSQLSGTWRRAKDKVPLELAIRTLWKERAPYIIDWLNKGE